MIGMTIGYLVFTAVVWCFIGQELRHAPTKREWQGKETDTEIQTDNRPEKDAYPPQNASLPTEPHGNTMKERSAF